jgi:hypothetical protein
MDKLANRLEIEVQNEPWEETLGKLGADMSSALGITWNKGITIWLSFHHFLTT